MIHCYNWDPKTQKCKVHYLEDCPENCDSRITSATKYLENLESLYKYAQNKNSKASLRSLRNEIKEFKEKYSYNLAKEAQRKKSTTFGDWVSAYNEDLHRGSGGGGSSEQDSNNKASEKQKMKDNRSQSCKLSKAQREEIREVTQQFEENKGIKLPKLGRSMMSHSRVDSYTGIITCSFNGEGYTAQSCEGHLTQKGKVHNTCLKCQAYKSEE